MFVKESLKFFLTNMVIDKCLLKYFDHIFYYIFFSLFFLNKIYDKHQYEL